MQPSCAQVSAKSILTGALTPERSINSRKSFRSQLCPRVSWQLA
ncbi:unnamed protein product [Brassica napus]|uniref:(rape) hypothetical protein n=1 Tax=Brassica napus TaxID=3708 RepID=A0A816PXN7_BRANA|nr:unnamed protein product [Brassica napus]CAF2053605.1 unnamed protein product [Brassica napus]